jgi:hypothetical protein
VGLPAGAKARVTISSFLDHVDLYLLVGICIDFAVIPIGMIV